MIRSYSGLSHFDTFESRFSYLRLGSNVGRATFGFDRWINQKFYQSREWKQARDFVIVRDNGCDLGVIGREIAFQSGLIHHMNPMTPDDIVHGEDWIVDPEYLILCTQTTHNAIHYGTDGPEMPPVVTERKPGDTKLW